MQLLTIAGTVGKDAELRTTQGGDNVLGFSVAVDNGKDQQGNKRPATWYDASIWGKRATSLQPYITKGLKITLTGRPTARAHDGKAYMGISVDQLALQGGGQPRQEQGGYDQSPQGYGDAYREKQPSGGGRPGNDPYDGDSIPFQHEWRG